MVVAPLAVFTDYIWLDKVGLVMLAVLGFFIIFTGYYGRKEAKASLTWPMANGILERASLKYHRSNNSTSYAPDIKVAFEVLGKEYTCITYDFSSSYTRKDIAQAKIDELKQQQNIIVYYNPEDPTVNVHKPGVHITHFILMVIGLGALVGSLGILFGYITLK
tara:strand:+ start:6056 stop:6544 length:489 start_codon:yes stop_codon:yes gene_type:complete